MANDIKKRIALFSDGTGNSSAKLFKTNVWRLYQALDLTRADQIAYYDDGVGTSSFKPLAVLGGALGVGLARNVRDIYAFVCRHYRKGDEIYGFGFSRGSFTMRVVAGMICTQGIITDFQDESDLRRKATRAFRDYRLKYRPKWPAAPIVDAVRRVRDVTAASFDRWRRRAPYVGPFRRKIDAGGDADGQGASVGTAENDARITAAGNAVVNIQMLGLWDTVDAYGLPTDEMTRAWDDYIWPLSMRDRVLNEHVLRARHALSLDDERNTFHPLLWSEENNRTMSDGCREIDKLRIAQVWFAGVHTNVGGGYPDDGLGFISLDWMAERADISLQKTFGLRFHPARIAEMKTCAVATGKIYDSRHGLSGYYRYQPRRFDLLQGSKPPAMLRSAGAALTNKIAAGRKGKAKNKDLANAPAPLKTSLDNQVKDVRYLVHESVTMRIGAGTDDYAPLVIPRDYEIVTGTGAITGRVETDDDADKRVADLAKAFNWVWLRRVVFFATLFTTLVFAATPFYLSTENTGGADRAKQSLISTVPDAAAGFLPSLARPWIDVYAAQPYWFAAMAGAIAGLLWLGGRLARTIDDRVGNIWRRQAQPSGVPGFRTAWLDRAVFNLRESEAYKWFFRWLKGSGLPFMFFIMFAYTALAVGARIYFTLVTAPPERGAHSNPLHCAEDNCVIEAPRDFDTREKYWASGIALQGGRRYEITVTTAGAETKPGGADAWRDGATPADVFGLSPDWSERSWPQRAYAFIMFGVAVPLRRDISQPWFRLFVRTGREGRDEHALSPKRPPPEGAAERLSLVSEFTARANGEMFLFVNDAIDLPFWNFYENNRGTAKVKVKALDWDPTFNK